MHRLLLGFLISFVAFAQLPLPNGSGSSSGGSGSGTVNSSTTGKIAYYASDGSAVSGSNCTIDAGYVLNCAGGYTSGAGSGKTGYIEFTGTTSGGAGWSAADAAGTRILYLLPTTAGDTGQSLTDNGVATCPTLATGAPTLCHQTAWTTVSGGGGSGALVLVEQHTASSSASLNFTTCISSTYDEYQIEIVSLIPATNSVNLLMRVSTNGGSSYDSGTNYSWAGHRSSATGSTQTGSEATTSWGLDAAATQTNVAARGGFVGTVKFYSPGNGVVHPRIISIGNANDNTTNPDIINRLGGSYRSTTAVNAFQVLFSSGNIASGIIRCYGIAK